ncbi:MAG: UDP-4-amino-4,6-dideoxy-N-acetyl-beta-L-altrosamine transaminase [Bacteroidota bacterium]
MRVLNYGKHYMSAQDMAAVCNALQSDFITQGPRVAAFEKKFAEYIGCKYAVAVANGTAALHLSAMGLGTRLGSKVITTPITFAASANCVRYCGGDITFVDINPDNILIDLEKVKVLLESSPKGTYAGIIPVDFAGYPVDLKALRALADEYGMWILEDSCHAPGGFFVDQTTGQQYNCGDGTFADAAIFSFHPVKHIACGEGGMITTNNEELYQKLLLLRNHGITKEPELLDENHGGWYYEMQTLGFNYRMTEMQAALGISQLDRAEEGIARRREIARKYDEAFQNTPIETFSVAKNIGHAYHLYIIKVNDRKAMYDALREKNIYAQIHYIPVHTMPYYQSLGYQKGSMPAAEAYYEQCISLPMFPTLTNEEQDYVIEKVKEFALCEV